MSGPQPIDPTTQARTRSARGMGDGQLEAALTGAEGAPGDLRDLLSLLDTPAAADRALVDVTLARILRVRAAEARGEPVLSDDDREALDGWVIAGLDADDVAASLRPRARRLEQIGTLVTSGGPSVAASADLGERTLARIQEHIDRNAEGWRLQPGRRRVSRPAMRIADLVSVAAVIMLGSAVALPMMGAARDYSRRVVCNDNLRQTAMGFDMYARGNRDALPMATAGLGPAPWWDVQPSAAHSNSANLYTLARDKYVDVGTLSCPGNPVAPACKGTLADAWDWRRLEEVSYSYQIMFGPARPTWNGQTRTVVLADRSPIILAAVRGEMVSPTANAPNHVYRGQHLLWNDGSAQWQTSPVLPSGDNIWLPRSVERQIDALQGKSLLKGRELPDGVNDVFLGP